MERGVPARPLLGDACMLALGLREAGVLGFDGRLVGTREVDSKSGRPLTNPKQSGLAD